MTDMPIDDGKSLNPSYVAARPDIEALIPTSVRAVLDVGCSVGTLGLAIKIRHGAKVTGIELSPVMAAIARTRLDSVIVGDADEALASAEIQGQRFDVIIFADVLEHLQDPWATLRLARGLLAPNGSIITSIPNIRHLDTIWNLVIRGRWPYRDRGIHDRTHLRFFTRADIADLMRDAGLQVEVLQANYRIIERPHDWNRFAHYLALPVLKEFLAFQYLVRARVA